MAKTKLGVEFGVSVPTQDRTSYMQPLYDSLLEQDAERWTDEDGEKLYADVTDAIANLVAESDGNRKTPTAQGAAVTLRKNGFEATTRGDRVFARPQE